MKILILLLALSVTCYANPINTKYSQKDFTGKTFTTRPASEFNDTTIQGSCFYQPTDKEEAVLIKVFPDTVKNLKLVACNLDNAKIPSGAIIVGELNCNRVIKQKNNCDVEATKEEADQLRAKK